MAPEWARGTEQPLELNTGDYVIEDTVSKLRPLPSIEDLISRGEDDAPDLYGLRPFLIAVIYGLG